jgi:hypothetical protein
MRTRPLCRDHGGDPRSLELAASIERRQRTISEQEAAMIAEIAEYNANEAWRGDGSLSMRDWLVARCHTSPGRARTLVAAAEALGELPRLHDALSEGDITLDVLAPLIPIATRENDARLAAESVHWTPRRARECAAGIRGQRDADAARQFARRCVRFNDEQCSIWAQFTKDGYAAVKSAIVGRARLHTHPSSSDADYESFENRCADALVNVCIEGGRRAPSGGKVASGGGGGKFGGSGTTMVVHVDLATLLQGDGYGDASIEGVGPISAEVARRLACNAHITLSFEAPDGTCLDQKPLRRDPTAAQRIEIARRDNGCRFPGCACSNVTDVHHVVWASKQGPSVLSNLLTLCVGHHSRVHELGWKLDGNANHKVTFTDPHGVRHLSLPSPTWKRTFRTRK